MRIKLKKGKQKELILKAKNGNTWKQLAIKLNINEKYLYYELKNEIRYLKEDLYKKLCEYVGIKFDHYIEKRLEDNWGQSKGGFISPGSTKKIGKPVLDENLSEFIGIVLGDGHVGYTKRKGVGVYVIRIAGDLEKDREYHKSYIKDLIKKIFNLESKELFYPKQNERFLDVYSKEAVNFFNSMGIKPGNKIKNQSTIPKWIFKKDFLLRACLRGLIDTDGSIHRMSKKDPNLIRINFTNYNLTLLKDIRKAFILLGFNPSKIIKDKQIFLSRQKEITRYVKEIGFKNRKHLKRLEEFSPIV